MIISITPPLHAQEAQESQAAQTPPAPPPDLTHPLVELRIPKATGLPTLERRTDNEWQQTPCVLPCTLRLDTTAQYRISGDGVVDSDPFFVPPSADRVRLDVSTAPTMLRDMGTVFMVSGLVFVAGGGSTLLWPQDAHASSDDKTSKVVVGVGCLSIGVLTAALGVFLRVIAETTVKPHPADSLAEGGRR